MMEIYLISSLIIAFLLFLNKKPILSYVLSGTFIVLQIFVTFYEYLNLDKPDFIYFTPDALGIIFLFVLTLICIPVFIHTHIYFHKHKYQAGEQGLFYAAIVVLIMSLTSAYLANHIGTTWIFVELTTLSASALIYHRRNDLALEATWKYIFVCSVSIMLVFIGILFLSFAIKDEGLKDLSYNGLMQYAANMDKFWLKLAFLFIFTGFTSKLGLVPMYTAGIDAKDNAPYPAAALFSSVLMNMGFLALFRVYEIICLTEIQNWASNLMLISGILSIFVATVYMLKVKNLKRLMAYSSVEHMGLVIIGFAVGGIGPYAAVLHLILHSFAKTSLFLQFGQIYRVYKSKSIYDLGNYFHYNTTGAMVLLLAFFTITAMPPSGMFISEFLIFSSLFKAHKIWLLVIILILLTLIIWSFGKNIFKIMFIKPVNFNESNYEKIKPIESLSQFIFLGLVIYLGFNPPLELVTLIQTAVKYISI